VSRDYNPAPGASTKKRKKLAKVGRNVEVQGGVILDNGAELVVRCDTCGALAPMLKWMLHGSSRDPHKPQD
jgi:hypothetical protein